VDGLGLCESYVTWLIDNSAWFQPNNRHHAHKTTFNRRSTVYCQFVHFLFMSFYC